MPESTERGALTEAVYYILLSLFTPLHGYGIMQKVRDLSGDRVSLGAGTLKSSRKKEYEITNLGRDIVKIEIIRLNELIENGYKTLEGME